ncbi:MAG: TSUP family transporter [Thermaurantiacus sp.]
MIPSEPSALLALFLAAFLAAAVSASAGFGGALLLLPLLVRAVGAEAAVPLLTIAQLAGNASRMALGRREIAWAHVSRFLAGAVPGAVLGAHLFVAAPPGLVTRAAGAAILGFVALRAAGWQPRPTGWLLPVGGLATGLVSGLVGSAGPMGAAIFLTLGLPPLAYVASEAATALAMHGTKLLVWSRTLGPPPGFWPLALGLAAAMLAGTAAARRLVARLPRRRFEQAVGVLLVLAGAQMLLAG